MSTLFLIGNGFDVNCGMKTRYTDVYKGYVKETSTNDILEKFKNTIDSNLTNWGDFEMAMAQYAESLESEEELLECVRDFAQYMEKHLLEEQNAFKKRLSNKRISNAVMNEIKNSLSSFYVGISHNVNDVIEERDANRIANIGFISFNYTDVFDILLAGYTSWANLTRKKVIHIHGVLQDDPVFGVDNIEQIKAKYILSERGKRGFIKPVFNEKYDRKRVQQAEDLIVKADTICTYGMSLGKSDLSWRNALIDWVEMDENHHLFIYQYSLSSATEYRTRSEKMDKEDAEKVRLLSEWGIDNMEAIFDQIHIPCGKNIFNVKAVIEKVEKEIQEEQERERKKTIEKGKEFIERHSQEEATG